MKKYYFLCIMVIFIPLIALSEEYPEWLHPSHGHNLQDILFTNENEGWIVGNPGFLLHTADGGDNWEFIESETTARLNAIIEHNGSLIAVGDSGIIIRSYNNGATWELNQIEDASAISFVAIDFKDLVTGFILGMNPYNNSYSKMWVTTDGGNTWEEQPEDYPHLTEITFSTQTTGWAVGYVVNSGMGILYKTIDGGVTWNETMQWDTRLYTINFIDELHGWIGGEDKFLLTNNGGVNWEQSETNFCDVEIYDMFFPDSLSGWCVTRSGSVFTGYWWGEIYHTNNGGINWDIIYEGTPDITYSFNSITGIENHLWTCGSGNILHSNNLGDDWLHQSQMVSRAMLSSLVVCGDNIWTYGRIRGTGNKMVFFSENDGMNWSTIDPDSIGIIDPFTLDFVNEDIGWIAGKGNIIKTTTGGDTWFPLFDYNPDKLYGYIDFADSNHGWCQLYDLEEHEEDERAILHTNDGGWTWETQTIVTRTGAFATSPNNLRALNSTICWYCGLDGRVWRTINSGETWEEVASVPTYYSAACIEPISATEAFVGTDFQRLSHTVDGGQTWETITLLSGNYPGSICDIRFQGDVGFAISWTNNLSGIFHSRLFKTIDHGENWSEMQPPMTEELTNCAIDNDDLMINGDHSAIVKYNDILTNLNTENIKISNSLPKYNELHPNYPNPFNPITTITYTLPEKTAVTLNIYDITGKLVTTLVDGPQPRGYHTVQWNGTDHTGDAMPSGVYFYRLHTDNGYEKTRKMLLLK